jgi:hypothetical protein
MTDRFVETSSRGFFSRIGGAFIGLLFGPLLVIGAVVLLSWNEGRAVEAATGLSEGARSVVEVPADSVSPANEGKLVHVIGTAGAQSPIQDGDLNLDFGGQLAVKRMVEMYQWREKKQSSSQDNLGGGQTTTTTYTYEKEWSPEAIDSSTFAHGQGHENPPMPLTPRSFAASDAKLGGFALDADTLGLIDPDAPLNPQAPAGWKNDAGGLYKGDNPAQPAIGDVRVHYAGLASGSTLSVLAEQSHGGFAAFTAPNGYQIRLAAAGNVPAAQMIAQARKAAAMWTWILRGVGALVMFVGFMLFFGPLAILASVLPFLGALVRGASAAFALVLTLPITLVTIAVAWIAFRPLIGGGLIVAAIGVFYALMRWHHARTPTAGAARPA